MRLKEPLRNAEPLLPLLQTKELLETLQRQSQRLSMVRQRKGRGKSANYNTGDERYYLLSNL